MSKHTLQEIAADPELWTERIDPHDNAPFDDFTQGQREEIIWQSFGGDFNDDGTPVNTHGGSREGAGRPPISDTVPTEKHTLTAPASIWRTLERVGDGNRSKGLRRVVAAYEFAELSSRIAPVSPDDGLPVDDADVYLDPDTISIVDGVGYGMFRDRATGRTVGMAQFDPDESDLVQPSAITMRPKPEVSHYGDGEPLDDGPDLRMESGNESVDTGIYRELPTARSVEFPV